MPAENDMFEDAITIPKKLRSIFDIPYDPPISLASRVFVPRPRVATPDAHEIFDAFLREHGMDKL